MSTIFGALARNTDETVLSERTVARRERAGSQFVRYITSTDHKVIGNLYMITSFAWFLLGGLMAVVIRLELWAPGLQVVDNPEQYNEMFTMHGTIMLLLFATPVFAGFANAVMPLQIGAPDVSFPRLNMFAYWLYLFGGIIAGAGLLTPGGAASFGWTGYAPLSNPTYSPGVGGDLWVWGLTLAGFGTILGAVNFITTIICMRAPGMTMFRMPLFSWTVLITSVMILMAFPVLASALIALGVDRRFGGQIFAAESGGALLWQHLFWFFGHPEVYIIALPFFGIVSEITPVFSRKPLFGYKTMVFATIAIAGLSISVWAHHMYATGQVFLPFFAVMTMAISVPTGLKFFNWIGTMWGGKLEFKAPFVWALGFLATFLFGGLTGIIMASPAMDFQIHDSYFIVAHFHYVLFGTIVFSTFGGIYFWWPKWTGRMLDDFLGKVHFWLVFVGFHTTFLIQHWLGVEGMPRRYADYMPEDNFQLANQISTVGSLILAVSFLPFFYNIWKTHVSAPLVEVDDPWGYGGSLEWATSCPPPRHNFTSIPPIRSERPTFDMNHPEYAPHAIRARMQRDAATERTRYGNQADRGQDLAGR